MLWAKFHSRPILMSLVARINTCQVGALAQRRRGQTATESGEKIIILIMMPRRPPFIHQATSTPPSVILSPDQALSTYFAANLIDFLHKRLIFVPSSSPLLVFIPLLLRPSPFDNPGHRNSKALPLSLPTDDPARPNFCTFPFVPIICPC